MICVYDIGNTAYEKNGNAVLLPVEGKIRQVAGGGYDLTLKAPIDPDGKWAHLVPEAVIKAPVPEETIENARSGLDADVYVTTTEAALREGTSEPAVINYDPWSASGVTYAIGDKVTYINKNYKMHALDPQTEMGYNHPPDNYPEYWTEIAR